MGRLPKMRLHKRSTLDQLADATSLLLMAREDHDTLIEKAIAEGHSERVIAKAAGMSGPAINQRKARSVLRSSTSTGRPEQWRD